MNMDVRVPYIRRDHRSRQLVGSQKKQDFLSLGAFDSDQMTIHLHAEERPLEALAEKADRVLLIGIGHIDALEGQRIAFAGQPVDVRREASVVYPLDAVRRQQRSLRLHECGVGIGQEVGQQGHQVE